MFLKIVLIISLFIFVICAAYFTVHIWQARKMAGIKEDASLPSVLQTTDNKVYVPIDFKMLKKVNPDIYAWIKIPNTKVDYPVLQSEKQNGYYLNRTTDRSWSAYGSIYSENYNGKDFMDFNTLLYGHNMRNGTMFGSLKKFRDATFFKENRYIYVYMENRILKYEIFAACTWDNLHILANRNFDLEENRTTYIQDVFAVRDMNSQLDKSIQVTAQDRIITLSTCMNDKKKRFIVSGVLIYDSQNS